MQYLLKFMAIWIFTCVNIVSANGLTTTGVEVKPLVRFSLQPQIPTLQGYDVRSREITVAPGGAIAEHEHSKRAGIVYVQSGTIIEYRGTEQRVLKAGDTVTEDINTVHAFQNVSGEACVLIAFDVPASE